MHDINLDRAFHNLSMMSYGDHAGKLMQDIPDDYLLWLWNNNRCNVEVKGYIILHRKHLLEYAVANPTPYSVYRRQFRKPTIAESSRITPGRNIKVEIHHSQEPDERYIGPVEEFAYRYGLTWHEARNAIEFLNGQT